MSIWYEIKNPEDIEISEDGKTVEILIGTDYSGNIYVEIPVKILRQKLGLKDYGELLHEKEN